MKYHERRRLLRGQKNVSEPEGIDQGSAKLWMHDKQGDYGEEALELLAAYGITTTASKTALTGDEAVTHAEELGFPVVMKVISPDAIHKSDAGGVLLGLDNREQVAESFSIIRDNLSQYNKDAHFGGVRIQKMAPDGYDMFVGGRQDPSFGPVVFFGMGGIYVEVFEDVANVICPARHESVEKRLKSLKSALLLEGLRGKAAGDVSSFIDLVVRTSYLLASFPGIKELDINPVRVFPDGKGVMALDARVRLVI